MADWLNFGERGCVLQSSGSVGLTIDDRARGVSTERRNFLPLPGTRRSAETPPCRSDAAIRLRSRLIRASARV